MGQWTDRTLAVLPVEQLVGQVLWSYWTASPDVPRMVDAGLLGGIVSRGAVTPPTPASVAEFTAGLQRRSPLPLLFLEDFEFGVGYLVPGATEITSFMGLGATADPECAREAARITAVESRALGYHVLLAPILDVNVNPANPIINIRSFGEDPRQVAEMGLAFFQGAESAGVIACGKHFPGHGDTDVDSHLELPVVPHSRQRMDAVELVPFRRCIDAGMSFIMSAHIVFPAVDPTPGLPATLSRKILTGLLRDELGFKGVILTDAMAMKAITDHFPSGEAEVRAVEAGADFVLCAQPAHAHKALLAAVRSGRVSLPRLRDSVRRLLAAKERLALHETRAVDLDAVASLVGTPRHRQYALDIARKSITLLRGRTPCFDPAKSLLAVIHRAKRFNLGESHQVLAAELAKFHPSVRCLFVDESPQGAPAALGELESLLSGAGQVLLATFARVEAYKASSGGKSAVDQALVAALARSAKPLTAVSFGSPYVLGRLAPAHNLLAAWYDSDVCIQAACQVVFGKEKPRGRRVVAIPGL
jgi:beta-glucosidase-like glycosyl hydrolase